MRKGDSFREFIKSVLMRLFWIIPIKKKKIVFSCFSGKSYGDSPRAIAEEIIRQKLDYDMYWLMLPDYDVDLPKEIKRIPMSFWSQAYHLSTAHIWVDSHTKWDFVRKRKGQYYIETWHGGLGKKVEGDAANALPSDYLQRTKHNAELADLFISNSTFNTEQYRRAFWYKGEIMECGCPKNDIYFSNFLGSVTRVKRVLNIPENTKIALYAPTFRVDEQLKYYSLNYDMVKNALKTKFGGEWCVLVRLHPVLMKKADNFIQYSKEIINASQYDSMQDLLVSADDYITDYSSPMFEICMLKKPVFLFATDFEEYMKDRGWYFDYFNMPFLAAQNNEELVNNIINFSQKEYETKLIKFWEEIGLKENGTASKQVVERIKTEIK